MNESCKPAEGERWTDKLALGHEKIRLEDMISPEFYELEREAVFRKSWLYVGRIEQVAAPRAYFTKEIEVLKASILVVNDRETGIRVFYNVCPHRGAKLVWDTYADREVSGRCATFVCKFHGLGFNHNGSLKKLTDPKAWIGNQAEDLHLAEVPFELWNGFIFVNLNHGGPQQTLREFIGEKLWHGLNGFPFGEMTERYYATAEANANWKTMMDGFGEVYHATTTHQLPFPIGEVEYSVDYFGIHGKHRQYLTGKFPDEVSFFDYERQTRAFATGPRYPFAKPYADMLPSAANPIGLAAWGTSSTILFPNFYIQFYTPGWYLTYAMWPLAVNKMRFEIDMHMPPARQFSELLAHKAGISMFLEAALQDFSLLEAQHAGLEIRAFDRYPLTDQEVCVRHFHQQIQRAVEEYRRELVK